MSVTTLANLAASALNWANVIIFSLTALFCFRQFIHWRRPINAILTFLGVYWAALYFAIILQERNLIPPFDPVFFGRIFVRPAFTLTGAIMLYMVARGHLTLWLAEIIKFLNEADGEQPPQ